MASAPRWFLAFVSACACLACAFALFFFASFSGSTTWKDYRMLCVSPPEREDELIFLLGEAGLKEYVTEANSPLLPAQSMTPFIPFIKEAESLRSKWFYDSTGEYRIVYIDEREAPRNYAKALGEAFELSGFSWVIEQGGGAAPLPLFLLLAFALFVGLFFKPFPAMPSALVFALLFAFSGMSFLSWASAFLWMCAIAAFFAAAFPKRKTISIRQLLALSRKALCPFIPLAAAAAAFAFASGRGALFLIAVPLGSAAAVAFAEALKPSLLSGESLWLRLKERKRAHPPFRPELMLGKGKGARLFLLSRLKRRPLPSFAFIAGVLLALAALVALSFWGFRRQTGAFFYQKEGEKLSHALYIPAPQMYTSTGGFSAASCVEAFGMGSAFEEGEEDEAFLFSLSDFAALQWNVFAYPWRKIDEPFEFPREGDIISYADYALDASGALSLKEVSAGTFDTEFIMMVFEECSSPLERMLMRQGRFCAAKRRQLSK